MECPERSPLRVKAACFEGAFDRRVTRMDLRGEAADAAAAGMLDESFEESSSHATISPRMLDEQFDEIHCFSAILRSPLMARIGKTANGCLIFCDENDAEFRRLQHSFINPLSVASRCARIPLMKQFLSKLTQLWYVLVASGPELNCRCL